MTDSPPPPPPERAENPIQAPISARWETAIRMTTAAFVGFCLAYAGDHIYSIPTSQAFLVGLLPAVVTMRIPTNVTMVVPLIPHGYIYILICLAFATALLAAATVSDGLFVAMSAIFGLWMAGLRFGPAQKLTTMFCAITAVIVGMIALALFFVVRNGLTVTISPQLWTQIIGDFIGDQLQLSELVTAVLDEGFLSAAREKLASFLQTIDLTQLTIPEMLQLAQGALDGLREYEHQILEAHQLLAQLISTASEGICIVIPEGTLEGRTFCFQLNENLEMILTTQGGMWLVKGLWTWSGLDNPLAAFQNFLVVVGWAMLSLFAGMLLPPWRTFRYELSRIELPLTLRDAAWYMSRRFGNEEKARTNDELVVRQRLEEASNTFHNGMIAFLTAFEPRLLDNTRLMIPRNTFLTLKDLMALVKQAAATATVLDRVYPMKSSEAVAHSIQSLNETAKVLETVTSRNEREKTSTTKTEKSGRQNNNLDSESGGPEDNDPLRFGQISRQIEEATDAWLESMYPTANRHYTWKDGQKTILDTLKLWSLPGLAFAAQLVYTLVTPYLCYKGKYEFEKIFHCIKFAIGFTSLICMNVYWDAYRNYMVPVGSSNDPGYELASGTMMTAFSAWELMAYSFATMPTTEGTIKKCALRIVGTCIGAFSAWALLRATGDNEYGSVAWLTVTSLPAMYISIDNKPGLHQRGRSEDYGYGGFYFVLTQTIIVMEYLAGFGEKDELVVNRLVSNIYGILMATFLALIPPTVMGSDPKWALKEVKEIKSTLTKMARLVLEGNSKELEKLSASYAKTVHAIHADAAYLLEDAARFSSFPLYRVDPLLEEEFLSLAVTSSIVSVLLDRASAVVENGVFREDIMLQTELKSLLSEEADRVVVEADDKNGMLLTISGTEAEILTTGVRAMRQSIVEHEKALGSVVWGIKSNPRPRTEHNAEEQPMPENSTREDDKPVNVEQVGFGDSQSEISIEA